MTNLSSISKDTLNDLFGIPLLKAFGFLEGALDIRLGDWLSDLYGQVSGAVALAGDILFAKEVNHSITVEASTTTNANGANLTLQAGDANGSGTDGVATVGGSHTSAVQLSASGKKLGFFGTTPVVQAGAYTLTYSTASRTSANLTSHTITDSSGGTASISAIPLLTQAGNAGSADIGPVQTAIATLAAELALVKADLAAAKQNVVAVMTDTKAYGLLG